jgi:2-oxoglutarate dehydrogenase E2 component (dihydrolipoamide succinyltransferase)
MTVSVEVPTLGESVTEAIIARWLVDEGDYVSADDIIAELDTDKISVDVPAPASGVVTSLKYEIDDDVAVGEVIAEIDTDAEKPEDHGDEGDADEEAAADQEPAAAEESEEAEPAETTQETTEAKGPGVDADEWELSPAVKRLIDQHGLDPAAIEGTGPDGRITKGDVLEHVNRGGSTPTQRDSVEPDVSTEQMEERVKMSSLRQTVADRLVEVQNDTAMLTTFNEADMSAVMELRKKYQDQFVDEYDTKLGFMSFFVKASIDALKRYPAVNAEIDDDTIVYKNYYNVGVAVGGPNGLVVPVIDNADQLSFADTEVAIQKKVDKVFNKTLSLDDLQGGTFTISNGGVYGSMMSTPILNPPQSAILGMHNIVERPVAVDGEVEIRPIMYLALSYDHRIIDGKEAVSFLKRIKECIENPERMLLEV